MGFPVKDAALDRLRQIVAVTMLINLFFFFSEIFTELYSFKHHAASMRYLLFGLHGHTKLVPYIWSAMALDVFAAVVFTTPRLHTQQERAARRLRRGGRRRLGREGHGPRHPGVRPLAARRDRRLHAELHRVLRLGRRSGRRAR